jgi:hypothetical protein
MAAGEEGYDGRIPTMGADKNPLPCCPQPSTGVFGGCRLDLVLVRVGML